LELIQAKRILLPNPGQRKGVTFLEAHFPCIAASLAFAGIEG
jgi:hypothetical protein